MSAIVVLPILIPPAIAAWPIVVTAAGAAAAALGFAATKTAEEADSMTEVELPVANAAAVADQLATGEELVFTRDDVQVIISALFDAYSHGRDLTNDDMLAAIAETVPLSKTMAEEVDALRNWSLNRARHASIRQDEVAVRARRKFEFE